MGNDRGLWEKLGPRIHHAIDLSRCQFLCACVCILNRNKYLEIQNFCCYSHRMQVHSNLLLDRMQHLVIENVLDLLYPKSICSLLTYLYKTVFLFSFYLHCDKTIIYKNFFGQEVSTNSSLVLIRELFVYILIHQGRFANTNCKR